MSSFIVDDTLAQQGRALTDQRFTIMMRYPLFQPSRAEEDDLLMSMPVGRLITAGADGMDVGLYPFVYHPQRIDIHLNANDPQLRALRTSTSCIFQVDEILSRIPSHFVHPESALYADALYRSVTIFGAAELVDGTDALIEHLEELLAAHQGSGSHKPIAEDPAGYGGALSRIQLVRITEQRRNGKFRLAQQEPEPLRQKYLDGLRGRGTELDRRSAALIEEKMKHD
jgi:uncharacterized protein